MWNRINNLLKKKNKCHRIKTKNIKYFSDSPIELNESNDLLGTKKLVEQIESIIDVVDVSEEAYVIGLQGTRGIGKSSIIKSININKGEYKVFHYSPRVYGNDVNLYEKYFDEFARFLKGDEFCSDDKGLGKDILEYKCNLIGEQLDKISQIGSSMLYTILELLFCGSITIYFGCIKFGIEFRDIKNQIINTLFFIFLGFTIFGICLLGKLIRNKYKLNKYWKNKKTIGKIKENISEKLIELKTKFIIIIDDIDRLKPDKIATILQLVKSTANFSNVIYILSYDKDIISSAINSEYHQSGNDYIEKFVQMEINIPKFENGKIVNIFIEKLISTIENINSKYGLNYYLDINWQDIIFDFLVFGNGKNIINSIRNVKRFINFFIVDFDLLHKNLSKNEIDIFDFIMIELIKFYDKKLYNLIFEKYLLMLSLENSPNRIKDKDGFITQFLTENKYDNSRKFYLSYLFKFQNGLLIKKNINSISNPDKFESYFILDITRLSNSEYENLIYLMISGSSLIDRSLTDIFRRGDGNIFISKLINDILNFNIKDDKKCNDLIIIISDVLSGEEKYEGYMYTNGMLLPPSRFFGELVYNFFSRFIKDEIKFKKYYYLFLDRCNQLNCMNHPISYAHTYLFGDNPNIRNEAIINSIKVYVEKIVKQNMKSKTLHKNSHLEEILACCIMDGLLKKSLSYKYLIDNNILKIFVDKIIKISTVNDKDHGVLSENLHTYFTEKQLKEILKYYKNDDVNHKILEKAIK